MKKLAVLLIFVSQYHFINGQNTDFKRFIENQLNGYPNCEIAIGIIDGAEEIKLGYSIVDGKPTPVDNSATLYEIGSISKTFASALFSREIQKGTMSLDDPIQAHLSFQLKKDSFENSTIKMNHLVTHTSGLKKNPLVSYKKYSKYLKGFELDYIPGTNWEYNNMTIALLAKMITEKNGQSWSDLLNKELLHPLNMQSTFINLAQTPEEGRVKCQGKNGKVKDCYFHKFQEFQWPAGGIISNVDDQLKWVKANMRADDAGLSFLDLAHDPLGDSITVSWLEHYQAKQGIVWQHYQNSDGERVIGHAGVTPSHTAFMAIDKKQQRGVIVLVNVNIAKIQNEHNIAKIIELAMKVLAL